MRSWAFAITIAVTVAPFAAGLQTTPSGDLALAKFSTAWDRVITYTCTITNYEVLGSHVQKRTYQMFFRKPHDTQLNITGGEGGGNAAVWHGGDRVKGREHGVLSFLKLKLDLHDPKVVTIRGTTIAEANFGAFFDHIRGLKGVTVTATVDEEKTKISVGVADPSSDKNVTRELMVLGSNNLPIEYDQWERDELVEHVMYTDVKLNVDIPDSTFNL